MSYRIFLTGSPIAKEARQFLQDNNCICEQGDPKDTPEDLVRKLGALNPDALIVRQGKINAQVQAAATGLKVICKHGVGVDNIDVEAATGRKIPVMFTPRANFDSTAEHTFALMLALLRQVAVQDRRMRGGAFDKSDYSGQELLGKTLGLIGFGKVARRLCELVAPFKVNVLAFHPSAKVEALPALVTKVKRVEEIYPQADIISIHCPLTPQTRGLINKQAIAQMKAGVYLVNTARGKIIDETDLVLALQEKKIRGAALDVFDTEPLPADHPFTKLDNVILTPHIAGVSDMSSRNMGMESARNVLAALKGEQLDPLSVINREILPH